jgi:hypothetical protein
VGRKRSRGRAGKGHGGGTLSSLRGGFRSVARGAAGADKGRPTSRGRRLAGNVITVLLLVAAVALLLRRFGAFR